MALRKYYVGSLGPFFYEDTNLHQDPDFVGQPLSALTAQGQISLMTPPTMPNEVARQQEIDNVTLPAVAVNNIDDPSAELILRSGIQIGVLLVAYQSITNAVDPFTLYCWDQSILAADAPYIVHGADSGFWVAIGGKYNHLFRAQTQNVITAIQNNAGTIQYKQRTLTFLGSLGTESNWTNL